MQTLRRFAPNAVELPVTFILLCYY